MHLTHLRKVGGSVMLTVPPRFLDQLQLEAGATVGLTIDKQGALVVKPKPQPRYSLVELLAESKAAGLYPLSDPEREWLAAPAAGREII